MHWFAIGWNRIRGTDVRIQIGMAVAYLLLSILGIVVFFWVGDDPVGGLFIGLTRLPRLAPPVPGRLRAPGARHAVPPCGHYGLRPTPP